MIMTIHHHPFYINIHRNLLLATKDKFLFSGAPAKASAFFPFIITTDHIQPDQVSIIINHELIHFAQQKETLLIGSCILNLAETAYYRLFKRLPARDAYMAKTAEQEAYAHMFNSNYLANRPTFAHLKTYFTHKPITWDNKWQRSSQ